MKTAPVIRLAQSGAVEFGPLLSLYERAIPASERRSREAIEQLARSPVHRISVLQRGQEILGFSILYLGSQVGLLEYLAVDERLRGAGLGARLYQEARLHLGKRPMVVEVEAVGDGGADLEERKRRAAFYQRLGCRRIEGLRYILPLIAEGAPPPLDLLVDGHEGAAVTSAEVRLWLRHIYVGAYDCHSGDPRIDLMLKGHEAGLTLS
jgi:ribosomal protein S18 acetylase RimI-like enzyme